ncbi:MAG TPA: cupin domain-containing protein [Methanocella sp.]|jgi:mannose-6-phosphate isomerase-like protein (cupin superfamily)
MCDNNVVELFADGMIVIPGKEIDAAKLPWYEHPTFRGVFLKDLVTAGATKGAFSCHVVRIKKGFEAGEHDHRAEWEFNEVLKGSGSMVIDGKKTACWPGFSYVTPPGMAHTVSAPDEDLYLLAKFVPALR